MNEQIRPDKGKCRPPDIPDQILMQGPNTPYIYTHTHTSWGVNKMQVKPMTAEHTMRNQLNNQRGAGEK